MRMWRSVTFLRTRIRTTTPCGFSQAASGSVGGIVHAGLAVVREGGLVKLGHVSIDGTKIKANASKHKAMSYGRMGRPRRG